ncbi:MAG: ribonuclease D [Anaerolineales bacterium]|nr:ribonuclease D [Anaerolineales bacterium]
MNAPTITPEMVTRPQKLEQAVQAMLRQPIVAVDTESNSLYAYQEQVCLIQFSIPRHDYLIDPLALRDVSPLEQIFANPKIEKIFHAAEYDLMTLRRDFGFEFRNLFDTMIAARILGRTRVGLGTLLEDEFDIHLEKKFQRANWGKRPLPPAMRQYASHDTHFLIRLRNLFAGELKSTGRWPIAAEDFARLEQNISPPPEPNGANVWRINGVRDLAPRQIAILQELAKYREEKAKFSNRPVFKVIGDRTLVAIAEEAPDSLDALSRLPGMSTNQVRKHGHALLQAVSAGKQKPPLRRPRSSQKDFREISLTEALRNWRKETARKMNVESDVILPRVILEEIGSSLPRSRAHLEKLMEQVPWRYDQYGEQIYQLILNEDL